MPTYTFHSVHTPRALGTSGGVFTNFGGGRDAVIILKRRNCRAPVYNVNTRIVLKSFNEIGETLPFRKRFVFFAIIYEINLLLTRLKFDIVERFVWEGNSNTHTHTHRKYAADFE